jgi:hypothetical protein
MGRHYTLLKMKFEDVCYPCHMSKLRHFLTGCLVVASATVMAQVQEVWVNVIINGKAVMGFVPAEDQSRQGERGVCSQVTEAGAKTSDGLPIRAFEFAGWKEGDRYRVLVYAMVPSGGPVSQTPCSEGSRLKRVEFDNVLVKSGEEFTIAKMTGAGMAPWVIRTGRKEPIRK